MTKIKQKHKFNVIDAIILVVILAVLAGLAALLIMRKPSFMTDKSVKVEYVVELRTIRDEFSDNFAVGQKLVDSTAKYQLGNIEAVKVSPATFTGTNLVDGTLIYTDYPEHSNVELTLSADAIVDENGGYVIDGGYRISVGSSVFFRTPDYIGSGYCTKFTVKESK